MARIRTIKPEFPQSESMGRVSRDSRLLFVQLWTLADDAGRLRGDSRMLASLLYPYDDGEEGRPKTTRKDVERWLMELQAESCIVRYENGGAQYIQICNWLNHQKIDKPSPPRSPGGSDEGSRILANPREVSSGDLDRDRGPGPVSGPGSTSATASPARKPGTRKPAEEPDWWPQFKARYPKRAGDPNWRGALKAANARIGEGHSLMEFLDGAERYAKFCIAAGKLGTEFVQQASTFLGPRKPFLLPWLAPAQPETATDLFMRRAGRSASATTNDPTVIDHDHPFRITG